jgi:hypothetical protein
MKTTLKFTQTHITTTTILEKLAWSCHHSRVQSPAYHHGDLGSISVQSMWNFWWVNCHNSGINYFFDSIIPQVLLTHIVANKRVIKPNTSLSKTQPHIIYHMTPLLTKRSLSFQK